jgi:Domain of unknown function DUF83
LLSSPRLGLIARVDILEGVAGAVRPVDVKRGSPPEVLEHAWEPERVQLCVQGLLLREAGYTCDEGIVYFAEARQRASVVFDEALITRTLQLVKELRRGRRARPCAPATGRQPQVPALLAGRHLPAGRDQRACHPQRHARPPAAAPRPRTTTPVHHRARRDRRLAIRPG